MRNRKESNEKVRVWAGFTKHLDVAPLIMGEVPYEEYKGSFPLRIFVGEIDKKRYKKNKMIKWDNAVKFLTQIDNTPPRLIWDSEAIKLDREDGERRLQCMKKCYETLTKWRYFPIELNRALNNGLCLMCWKEKKEITKCGLCFHCYCDSKEDIELLKLLDELYKKIKIEVSIQ